MDRKQHHGAEMTADWIDEMFAGYGIALRREEDPPIPGEPLMSMEVAAKRLAREAIARALPGELVEASNKATAGPWHVGGRAPPGFPIRTDDQIVALSHDR